MNNNNFGFSRELLLGGSPARRATTALFTIENRTVHLIGRSRYALEMFASEERVQSREEAFLDALAQGRDLPIQPTIQDLERYAPEWASLLPENVNVRAAIVQLMAKKYTLSEQHIPQIRAALNIDSASVQEAFQRLYSAPLGSIYITQLTFSDRLRWRQAQVNTALDKLSPFWIAFISMVMGTFGAGVLALPIAVAKIGPLAGLGFLLLLGLFNVLTVGQMAEAVARNSSLRYGKGFIGTVVNDYLGQTGSIIFSVATFLFCFATLLSFYIGISSALQQVTQLPAALWLVVLFGLGLYYLWQGSFGSSVASTLLIGASNIIIFLVLAAITMAYVERSNLLYVNLTLFENGVLDMSVLELVFGTMLFVLAGHISVANSARVVLQKDPSAKSLTQGSMAGLATVLLLYSLWIFGVGGALPADVLAAQRGTVLTPLGELAGPIVNILGTIYIILGLGLGSIHYSLGLYNLVRERLTGWQGQEFGRFLIGATPIILIFLLAQYLTYTGSGSFTSLISFGGVIAAPLFAGVFPILLLIAGRRKGDIVPSSVYRLLGHPFLLGVLFLVFYSSLLLYGLFIWKIAWQQMIVLLVSAAVLLMIGVMLRRGIFAKRLIVELRRGPFRDGEVVLVAAGQPLTGNVTLNYAHGQQQLTATQGTVANFARLQSATVAELDTGVKVAKVWVHQVSADHESTPLSAELIRPNVPAQPLVNGQALFPLKANDESITIRLTQQDSFIGSKFQ